MSFYLRLQRNYQVEPLDERGKFDISAFREERRSRTPTLRLVAYVLFGAAATFGATFAALQPKTATVIARAPLADPVTTGSVQAEPATTGSIPVAPSGREPASGPAASPGFAEPNRMLRPGWH